jgi:hypothetical protein
MAQTVIMIHMLSDARIPSASRTKDAGKGFPPTEISSLQQSRIALEGATYLRGRRLPTPLSVSSWMSMSRKVSAAGGSERPTLRTSVIDRRRIGCWMDKDGSSVSNLNSMAVDGRMAMPRPARTKPMAVLI